VKKGISMDDFENKWGMTREHTLGSGKLRGGETRGYHDRIISLVKSGLNAADIHRELRKDGYTKDPSTLRWYIKKYVDEPLARYHHNQYTRSNTCKQGHPWTAESTAYYFQHGQTVRRCRICINARERRVRREKKEQAK
jgi:hypothetical protein